MSDAAATYPPLPYGNIPVFDRLVLVRGGGDLGSGVALRLWRAGFPVVVLERPNPVAVRRTVSFSEAVYDGEARVEEGVSYRAETPRQAATMARQGVIAVLVDTDAHTACDALLPYAVVDAIMAKRNTGIDTSLAPLVVALGPGFTAGCEVHAVVETNRGPDLGRVIWRGNAAADTGLPAPVADQSNARVLRAPAAGVLRVRRQIRDILEVGDTVATVQDEPIVAQFHGLVRGLARDGLTVSLGMKIGDLDPRLDPRLCDLVSDKSLAIAGGVMEALLTHMRLEQ